MSIFHGMLEDTDLPTSHYDYIRLNHSFEHMLNPRQALRLIGRALKPTGKLLIAVPNVGGFAARYFGPYWYYLTAPVHPFGWSAKSLTKILTEEGFQIERIGCNTGYLDVIGSIEIYLNRNNGRRWQDGVMVVSPVIGLLGHWLVKILDLFDSGGCIEVTARLL